jgi:hypothetical protein
MFGHHHSLRPIFPGRRCESPHTIQGMFPGVMREATAMSQLLQFYRGTGPVGCVKRTSPYAAAAALVRFTHPTHPARSS